MATFHLMRFSYANPLGCTFFAYARCFGGPGRAVDIWAEIKEKTSKDGENIGEHYAATIRTREVQKGLATCDPQMVPLKETLEAEVYIFRRLERNTMCS